MRALAIAAVIAAAALWGTTGTIQALLPEDRQPLVVAAMRLSIGAAALLVLAVAQRDARAGFRRLPLPAVAFAGLAIGVYNVLFFLAVVQIGVGTGTAIAIGSAPVWVTLYETAVRRQLPSPRRAFGQAVSIAGACLLVLSGGVAGGSPIGFAVAGVAGSAYAAYSLATSRLTRLAPPATIASATFTVAALAVLPVLLTVPTSWVAAPRVWPALLFLGVFSTGLSYALYTWGLARLAASTAVTLTLVEPLTAWLLATFVIGEAVTPARAAGAALLLGGLAIVTASPARPTRTS